MHPCGNIRSLPQGELFGVLTAAYRANNNRAGMDADAGLDRLGQLKRR